MKKYGFVIAFVFIFCCAIGQNVNNFIFSEIAISVNNTSFLENEYKGKSGFGMGVYHLINKDKKLNILIGLEFNRANVFKSSYHDSKLSHIEDVTFNINSASLPLGLRYNWGNKTKIFFEPGFFAETVVNAVVKGEKYIVNTDISSNTTYDKLDYNEKINLKSTYGLYLSLGCKVPITPKLQLLIKPEAKLAMNPLYSSYEVLYNRYIRLSCGLCF